LPIPNSTRLSATIEVRERGHTGLLVLGSIALGLILGLLLVLVVFEGAEEAKITGSALLALGAGFMVLAVASIRFTDQPQRWALAPGYVVNGHHLYLNCVGTGAPAVVLFSGLGERTPSWAWVQASISSSTRVCVFDRAGEGWSGAAPGPQDGDQLASDLHELLKAAQIPAPYVLAGTRPAAPTRSSTQSNTHRRSLGSP
jgi:hypothetical protein